MPDQTDIPDRPAAPDQPALLTPAHVDAAAERIRDHAKRTPIVESTVLNARLDARVFCKAENLQRTGSFKFRGACNAIASLSDAERARGVLTYSSGNHGQAISRAAGLFGVDATVIMPTDAPAIKRAATEHWGAAIVPYDRYAETRQSVAQRFLAERPAGDPGPVLIPPYDHPDVMAGQGTVGRELAEQVPDLDLVFVCLGGGGLLSGVATAVAAHQPNARLIGVEPEAGDDHRRSRAAGRIVALPDVPRTIADGQQTTAPGALTWPITNALTDTFTTATDNEIRATMRLLFDHHKLVVEPSGACALAGALFRDLVEPGMRVGVTISGGNVDPALFASILMDGSDATGRSA